MALTLDSFDSAIFGRECRKTLLNMLLINELQLCVVLVEVHMHILLACIMRVTLGRFDVNRKKSEQRKERTNFPIKSLAKHFKILCYRIFIVHVTPERSNTRFCLSFRLRFRLSLDDFNMMFLYIDSPFSYYFSLLSRSQQKYNLLSTLHIVWTNWSFASSSLSLLTPNESDEHDAAGTTMSGSTSSTYRHNFLIKKTKFHAVGLD